MAADFSFDIVSRVDAMEVKNGVDQAQKELSNRYDFKGSNAEITHNKDDIGLVAEDEFRMDQLKDILISKASEARRGYAPDRLVQASRAGRGH